jgi:hypothetical protein
MNIGSTESLCLATCSILEPITSEQNRSGIHFRLSKLDSVLVAQGAAYASNGLCSKWYASGM